MRTLLFFAAMAIIAVALWTLRATGQGAAPVAASGGTPGVRAEQVPAALVDPGEVLTRVGETDSTVTRELALEPEIESGVLWPKGFGRVNLEVVSGGKPVPGAVVTVNEEVEPIFDLELEDGEEPRTDSRGRLSFYARPTRTFTLSAREPTKAWSVEKVGTTPFWGRERDIQVEFSGASTLSSVELLVVSERTNLPLEGVRVDIGNLGQESASHGTTDVAGRAEVPLIHGHGVQCSLDGYGPQKVALGEEEGALVRVALRPFIVLHGAVNGLREGEHRSRWKPNIIVAPRYGVEQPLNSPFKMSAEEFRTRPLGYSGRRNTRTAMDGTWRMENLLVPEGQHVIQELKISVSRGGVIRPLAVLTNVSPGDSIEVIDPWRGAKPWKVQLLYGDGTPVGAAAKLRLEFMGQSPCAMDARRDDEGWHHLPSAPRGSWNYSVTPLGHFSLEPITGQIQNDGNPATIHCRGFRQVAGKIATEVDTAKAWMSAALVEAGTPVPEIPKDEIGWASAKTLARIGLDGTFALECVPTEGNWEVVVLDHGDLDRELGRRPVPAIGELLVVPIAAPRTGMRTVTRSRVITIGGQEGTLVFDDLDRDELEALFDLETDR